MKNERIYRQIQPSDLPKVQSGKLKAFVFLEGVHWSLKLVSTRLHSFHTVLWLVDRVTHDNPLQGMEGVVVDVTPEKRYAVWNDTHQRFILLRPEADCRDRTSIQVECDEIRRLYPVYKYYVVEFEYLGEGE